MKNKHKNYLKPALFLVLIWFSLSVAISGYVLYKDPVSFGIQINSQKLERGENLILEYSASNNWFYEINNITVNTKISDRGDLSKMNDYNASIILRPISGNYSLDTFDLSEGDYVIISNLSYTNHKGIKMSKELSLNFEVID